MKSRTFVEQNTKIRKLTFLFVVISHERNMEKTLILQLEYFFSHTNEAQDIHWEYLFVFQLLQSSQSNYFYFTGLI